jgi:hypothetical protein
MIRVARRVGIVALLALVVAAIAAAATQPPTLSADPAIVTIATGTEASTTILAGTVPDAGPDDDVVIEAKECGATSYLPVRRGHTDASGAFHEALGPAILTSYRARAKGAVSTTVTVQTRPGIRFAHVRGTRFDVWMLALRFFDGRFGRLERFDNASGRWLLVKRVKLSRRSGVSLAVTGANFTAPAKRGWLVRFVLPRDQARPCYLAGFSPLVRVQ